MSGATGVAGSPLAGEGREPLLRVDAASLLHGAVRVTTSAGWTRPWRMGESQVRAVTSCLAWHPGLYRQMAACVAGVTVELDTDATEVALEVALDDEPVATAACLALVDGDGPRLAHDGVSADVDGRALGILEVLAPDAPAVARGAVPLVVARVSAEGREKLVEEDSSPRLPGMADLHRVRFHLPCLRGCRVRGVLCDGTVARPVPARETMLVIGDSITQGFACGDPSLAWPRLVADELRMDVVNQGLAGQVIQPSSLAGLPGVLTPSRVVVALGENYRRERVAAHEMARDARALLDGIAAAWPDAACWVLTPTWHDESVHPSRPGNCLAEVPAALADAVAGHSRMGLVDGSTLLSHDAGLLADGIEHPNAEGMRRIAHGVLDAMAGRPSPAHGAPAAEKGSGVVASAAGFVAAASGSAPARRKARHVAPADDEPMLPLDFGDFGLSANGGRA